MAIKKEIKTYFTADVDKFSKGVKAASGSLDRFEKKGASVTRSFRAMSTALASVVSVGVFVRLTKSALDFADNIGKASERTGFSVEKLQELRFAGDQTGVSITKMDAALAKFSKRLGLASANKGAANTALSKLGIDLKQSDIQIFNQVIDTIGAMEDGAKKIALTTEFFGENAQLLVNTFKNGTAGLRSFADEARSLGLIMDERLVRNAEKAIDKLSAMSQVISMQVNSALVSLAPTITSVGMAFANAAPHINAFFDSFRDTENRTSIEGMADELFELESKLDELIAGDSFKSFVRSTFGSDLDQKEITATLEKIVTLRTRIAEINDRQSPPSSDGAVSTAGFFGAEKKTKTKEPKLETLKFETEEVVPLYSKELESYTDQLARVSDAERLTTEKTKILIGAFQTGSLTVEQYRNEFESLYDEIDLTGDATDKAVEDIDILAVAIGQTLASATGTAADAIMDFAIRGENSFGDMAQSVGESIANMITQMLLMKVVTQAMGGSWFGMSSGPAPVPVANIGPIPSYANGTDFVPNDGLAYIHRGERITPKASNNNGGGTVVNITNNTGAPVRQESSNGSSGRELIEVVIGEVGRDISSGGPLSQVISQSFGTRRVGLQR